MTDRDQADLRGFQERLTELAASGRARAILPPAEAIRVHHHHHHHGAAIDDRDHHGSRDGDDVGVDEALPSVVIADGHTAAAQSRLLGSRYRPGR